MTANYLWTFDIELWTSSDLEFIKSHTHHLEIVESNETKTFHKM